MLQFSENSPNRRVPRQCVSHRGEILPDKDEQGLTILFERMICNYQPFNHYIIQYGVPLDNRHDYTKTDWLMWTAAMGSEEQVIDNYILYIYCLCVFFLFVCLFCFVLNFFIRVLYNTRSVCKGEATWPCG